MAARQEPPPCDTVYFGGLPEGTTEDSLVDFLQNSYGAKILWKKFFQQRAGSCAALVQFDSIEKAVEIKDALHMTTPDGATEPVVIRFKDIAKGGSGGGSAPVITDNDNLYMQNLPLNADAQMYEMWFSEMGTLTSFKILDSGTAGLFRFASPQEAQNVINVMNGKLLPGASAPLVIRPAEKKVTFGYGKGDGKATVENSAMSDMNGPYSGGVVPRGMSTASLLKSLVAQNVILDPIKFESDCYVVYVCGLPVDMDEIILYKMFAPFGSILSVCLQKKTSWSTGADFVIAFVNFGDLEGAENAISSYNQLQLPNGSYLKVTHKPPKADCKGKGKA